MKSIIHILTITTIGSITYIILGAGCLPKISIPVNGLLFGRPYKTTVDNMLAKEILSDPNNSNVVTFFSKYSNKPLNTQTLAEISMEYSMDVSTLYFIEKTYQKPQNKKAQDIYLKHFDQLLSNNDDRKQLSTLQDYYIVFVPGLNYLDTTNGGDFAKQRKLLKDYGVKNEMILTGNWGYTEYNAYIVAERLKELNKQHDKIILVSASKGGLDLGVALGKLLKADEISSVKAWVSVGGILKGSPLADTYLKWPKCWIAGIGLLFVKQTIGIVEDLSYKKRVDDFKNLNFPEHIKRIHFVGAPLSTQIHKRIKKNYCAIKNFGPNDGITPLADEITEGGIVVSELGLDHYYKHPDIDKKTIALALTIVDIQD